MCGIMEKSSPEEKINKFLIVKVGLYWKNCALDLEYGPLPLTSDL